jgi:protein-disulfide isomerase
MVLGRYREGDLVANPSGAPTIVAALIVSAALVGSAMLLKGSLDQTAAEIGEVKGALGRLEAAAARPTAAAQPGRPDPSRRYTVNTSGSPSRGSESAKIAIVEFSDFQCPFCSRVAPTLEQVRTSYPDEVRIVFKHLPLAMHSKAPAAHAAAEAAHRQGKFWEMHDLIFAKQAEMSPEKYVEYAQQIGLDVEKFKRDVASEEVKKKVDADAAEAAKLGVSGTPGFFVNGRFLSGAQPYPAFEALVKEELGRG